MTNTAPLTDTEVTQEIKSKIPVEQFKAYKNDKIKDLGEFTFQYDVEKYVEKIQNCECIITNLMIARPAFATCPVKTLLIFFENEMIIKNDLKIESFVDVLNLQQQNLFPNVIYQEKNDRYEYLEFQPEFQTKQKTKYNPTLCLQFLKQQANVIQLNLKQKRRCKYCYVILIDMDDRRQIYNMNPDIGLDINFIVFGGYVISS